MWTAVSDAASGSTYYWNEQTGETAWEPPADAAPAAASSTAAAAAGHDAAAAAGDAAQAAAAAAYYASPEYAAWYHAHQLQLQQQQHQQQFQPKAPAPAADNDDDDDAAALHEPSAAALDYLRPDYTLGGNFNARTGRFTTGSATQFDHISKAERQMSAFFDLNAYQEERNRAAAFKQPPKRLTKKELDRFKERAKMKKKERLLKRLGDD